MASAGGDFDLTTAELRTVVRFSAESAEPLLPVFEAGSPGDPRPRAALDAAWSFCEGGPRTNLQRLTAVAAHRAAREAPNEPARLAARACGDAAGAAYLHPLAQATQVGHIVRAAACAALVAELTGGREAAAAVIASARERATAGLLDVLRRYPPAPVGRNRLAQLMSALDEALRAPSGQDSGTGRPRRDR